MNINTPNWSSLPGDIIANIAKRLQLHSVDDICRFRAVCHSFRSSSSVALPPKTLLPPPTFIIDNLSEDSSTPGDGGRYFLLTEATVYAIEPLEKISNPHDTTQTWLVQIQESNNGKFRIEDPLTGFLYENSANIELPKSLNLLDYRVKEITKAYRLELATSYKKKFEKGVRRDEIDDVGVPYLLPKIIVSRSCDDGFAIMATHNEKKELVVWRNEDKKWTNIDTTMDDFADIVYHNKKFYVVCFSGLTIAVDPKSLSITEIAERHQDLSTGLYHLVESLMDLFLVVDVGNGMDLDIYRLDEEKHEWVRVKDELEDRALFVGDYCTFSLSTKEFLGCKGNCVYFVGGFIRYNNVDPLLYALFYDLKERTNFESLTTLPSYSKIFWPPPTWIKKHDS